ncbi:MAG: hypothetical protein E1N59_427 [Puniceicoccaceae bacterium 5H]|nr:MAG: hypothetical protein E1N59_427 [Puniceicoccaceae bacterium 5H]
MILETLDRLILAYQRFDFPIAKALNESLPIQEGLLDDFKSTGWRLPREMEDLYLYKNGIPDRWVEFNACMLPGFFFEPFERSAAFCLHDMATNPGEHGRFEFLVDYGGDSYFIKMGAKEIDSTPVFYGSPYSDESLHRYDSVESMLLTISRLVEVGFYENVNDSMDAKIGFQDVESQISYKLNPNAIYWRRRLKGVYE